MKNSLLLICAFYAYNSAIAQIKTTDNNAISLIQTELPTGKGDTDQRILAVKIAAADNAQKLSALKFTMSGTSNIKDVINIKVQET